MERRLLVVGLLLGTCFAVFTTLVVGFIVLSGSENLQTPAGSGESLDIWSLVMAVTSFLVLVVTFLMIIMRRYYR